MNDKDGNGDGQRLTITGGNVVPVFSFSYLNVHALTSFLLLFPTSLQHSFHRTTPQASIIATALAISSSSAGPLALVPDPAFADTDAEQQQAPLAVPSGRGPPHWTIWWLAKSARLKRFSCTTHSIRLARPETLNLLVLREQENKSSASPPYASVHDPPNSQRHKAIREHPQNKLS